MSDYFVRAAGPADAEALAEMEAHARSALRGTRGGDRRLAEAPPVAGNWAERCDAATWLVLVSGLDGVLLGYLAAELPAGGTVAVVEQVFVLEGAREIGLGDAMLEVALEQLRASGAVAVDGFALPGDRNTKNLFERNGLTARLITVTTSWGTI